MKTLTKIVAPTLVYGPKSPLMGKRKARKRTALHQPVQEEDDQTWSLRPPDDLRELLKRAMQATGSARQSLIFECIREQMPAVVRKRKEAQQEAQKSFDKKDNGGSKP